MGPEEIRLLIGQILGFVAVIIGFISYQMKSSKGVMFMQAMVSAVFCIHYMLLNAMSGFVLNIVCFIRNFVYFGRDKKILSGKWIPIAFAVIISVLGALSWQGWPSIFLILGLAINSICASAKNPQTIRKSILVTSPLVIIYDVLVASYGGILFETIVIVSSIIGLIRSRNKGNNKESTGEKDMFFKKKTIDSFSTIKFKLSGMRIMHEYVVECDGETSKIKDEIPFHNNDENDKIEIICQTQEIIDILNKCKVLSWDGFYGKHPKDVLDGTMFSLDAVVNDGKKISANGSQNFPKGFHELESFFYQKMKPEK